MLQINEFNLPENNNQKNLSTDTKFRQMIESHWPDAERSRKRFEKINKKRKKHKCKN